MGIQEMGADVCEICDCFSNSGFDLCEECAMKFTLWFFIKHHKNFNELMKKELILNDSDNLWGYSKVGEFMNEEFEKFKKESEKKFNWYEDKLQTKEVQEG